MSLVFVGEHHAADLDGADAALQVEAHDQRLTGKLVAGHVGQEAQGIQVDGVAARRLDDGDASLQQPVGQVLGMGQAVGQVVLVQPLPQPAGDGLQIAPGQAAVGGKSLAQDQLLAGPLVQRRGRSWPRKPPMLTRASFLALMVQPSAWEKVSRAISSVLLSA